ncbi:Ras-related protein Rab-18 [Reticulomyxa filosa]|uniref:Ras-related protein Rab-18 n=1 Tax=Reticulomyxa filosa TaxID=46433 RepID=X6N4R7_RETFI|nr:Ras-related protein Rab-18 [Reticulomyxa filosa]|eukprot:ETO20878.1 Ras-related protein Rab-18 [Reticulomyxa filosa]
MYICICKRLKRVDFRCKVSKVYLNIGIAFETHCLFIFIFVCFIVYDVTNVNTFKNLRRWLREVKLFATENVIKVLVGNKIDLEQNREVTRKIGSSFAREHGMLFFEASAKTYQGVQDAFDELVEKLLDTSIGCPSSINIANKERFKAKDGCCLLI